MAAGLGFKDFTTGEVLTAADVDGYLMQGVWVFASAAARDAAVTSPQEGNFAYLKDTNVTTYYTGSAWANLDTTGMTNPMTTTGDTIYSSSGSTPARLGIGTAGQVLTVAGGVPSWSTPAGGGGMTLIQETVANADTGITFGSIPGTHKQLLLVWTGIYHSALGNAFALRFNNSSTAEYANQTWGFAGGSADTESSISTNLRFKGGAFGEDTTSQTANNTVTANLYIDNYASTTKHKTYYGYKSNDANGTRQNQTVVGAWGNTAAITSLDIVRIGGAGTISNIANTSIRLYGIS